MLLQRLLSHVIIQPHGCWLYQGQPSKDYIVFWDSDNNKNDLAHRIMWRLVNGVIPTGQEVLHKCDIGRCLNPGHLFLGTQKDNMLDMVIKGRQWQQLKIHCKNGHPFNLENTYVWHGSRKCRVCNRNRKRTVR